jgi:hypothetical protein
MSLKPVPGTSEVNPLRTMMFSFSKGAIKHAEAVINADGTADARLE